MNITMRGMWDCPNVPSTSLNKYRQAERGDLITVANDSVRIARVVGLLEVKKNRNLKEHFRDVGIVNDRLVVLAILASGSVVQRWVKLEDVRTITNFPSSRGDNSYQSWLFSAAFLRRDPVEATDYAEYTVAELMREDDDVGEI